MCRLWAERMLDLRKLSISNASHAAFTTMTLNSRQASLRCVSQPPQRLVETEKWFRNPKTVECNFNESLPTSFRKGLSLAKSESLQRYQQRWKLLQWQVHLSLKDWRRWFHWWRQQKASIDAGYMFAFFFPFYKHTASDPQATRPGLKVVKMSWHFQST